MLTVYNALPNVYRHLQCSMIHKNVFYSIRWIICICSNAAGSFIICQFFDLFIIFSQCFLIIWCLIFSGCAPADSYPADNLRVYSVSLATFIFQVYLVLVKYTRWSVCVHAPCDLDRMEKCKWAGGKLSSAHMVCCLVVDRIWQI